MVGIDRYIEKNKQKAQLFFPLCTIYKYTNGTQIVDKNPSQSRVKQALRESKKYIEESNFIKLAYTTAILLYCLFYVLNF